MIADLGEAVATAEELLGWARSKNVDAATGEVELPIHRDRQQPRHALCGRGGVIPGSALARTRPHPPKGPLIPTDSIERLSESLKSERLWRHDNDGADDLAAPTSTASSTDTTGSDRASASIDPDTDTRPPPEPSNPTIPKPDQES